MDVEVADAVLLAVDGAVRGLAARAVAGVRVAAELGFAGADVEVFVVAVNGFANVDFTDVPDNRALGALVLLLGVVVIFVAAVVFKVDDVNGFLAIVVLTSPFTAVVTGFLASSGAFFSVTILLFVEVPVKLVRVIDEAVEGLAVPTVLLEVAVEA